MLVPVAVVGMGAGVIAVGVGVVAMVAVAAVARGGTYSLLALLVDIVLYHDLTWAGFEVLAARAGAGVLLTMLASLAAAGARAGGVAVGIGVAASSSFVDAVAAVAAALGAARETVVSGAVLEMDVSGGGAGYH